MGRLFWKFFFFIWLAQLATGLGIATLVWLKIRAHEEARPLEIATNPPANFAVSAAAATLRFGGLAALRELLEGPEPRRMSGIYAVDENNLELLGRAVVPAMLEEARRLAASPNSEGEAPRGARAVRATDGHTYTLFLPSGGPQAEQRRPPAQSGPWTPDAPGLERGPGGEPPPGPPPDGGPGPRPGSRTFGTWLPPYEPLLAGLVASLVFAALLALYIARPIRSLRAAFNAAATGKLDTRVGPVMGGRRDELADLGRDFDHMAGRLQSLIEGQRRLLHDVSHEMRSPLARMQAAIGLARQNGSDGAPPKPEKLVAAIERVERETVRMDQLVGELLTLARLEAGVNAGKTEEVNVLELVSDIVADARFEAQAGERRVEFEGGERGAEALVQGRAELLHRAFENVIRNAVKHTVPGSSVIVTARAGDAKGTLCVTVLDAGPGVRESELGSIFEPFFRGGNSSPDGHGLGLAIARRVIEMHGGTIKAGNRPKGGFKVEIVLPLMREGTGEA